MTVRALVQNGQFHKTSSPSKNEKISLVGGLLSIFFCFMRGVYSNFDKRLFSLGNISYPRSGLLDLDLFILLDGLTKFITKKYLNLFTYFDIAADHALTSKGCDLKLCP